MKKKQAFSLIELSIVILIIGILVAGVTSSSRLIRAMKLISAKQMTQSSPVLTIQDLLAGFEPTKEGIFGTGSGGTYTPISSPDDGMRIATWKDGNPRLTAGGELLATQTTLSSQPFYVENGINGLPTLNFVDDDFLQYADNVGLGTGATIFVVFKASDYLTFRQIFVGGGIDLGTSQNGGNKCVALAHLNGASGSWYGSWNSSNALSYDTSSGMLCRFLYSKGIIQAFMNGSPDGQTNAGGIYQLSNHNNASQNFSIDYIASQYINTTLYNFHGYISELIVFGRGLKTDEISDIEKYLAKKYSIKLTY
jgi:prepilin-type N-terminal cleavage/methylation domain-containing protein